MKKRLLGLFLALTLLAGLFSNVVFAEDSEATDAAESEPYVRTIMMYDCGSNLETLAGLATYNLHQILNANFSKDDKVKFIIMTGGSEYWQTPTYLLADPNDPDADITVNPLYNQVWEAKGADAAENPGKMVLLEPEGLHNKQAPDPNPDDWVIDRELMSDPQLLKDFINYCVDHYPAEKYDLILWDHGGGPIDGFGGDENVGGGMSAMSFADILDAISDNDVVKNGGKFDFIDFDACLMGSVELTLAFADYMDYYIASPELEPGYGQNYKGWLDYLGIEPGMDAFEIGKKIVDDFIAFYDKPEGDGSSQEGTLAVIDVNKLMENGFSETLNDLSGLLIKEATELNATQDDYLFYDEFDSMKNSIEYGDMNYYDLGTLSFMLSYDFKELAPEDIIDEETVIDANIYTELLAHLTWILYDSGAIYARGTQGIHSNQLKYRDLYGKSYEGKIGTCGLHIYFPSATESSDLRNYVEKLQAVIKMLPVPAIEEDIKNDKRIDFLTSYVEALLDYALIANTGAGVSKMLDEGTERSEINYDTFKNYMTGGGERLPFPEEGDSWDTWEGKTYYFSNWRSKIVPLLVLKNGGAAYGYTDTEEDAAEAAAKEWLSGIIQQQAEENISRDDTTLYTIKEESGTGYRIQVEDTQKRVIEDIRYNMYARLPAIEQYVEEEFDEYDKWMITDPDTFYTAKIGTVSGELVYENADGEPVDENSKAAYVEWYLEPNGIWNLAPLEESWYVVQDADGYLHAANIETDTDVETGDVYFRGTYKTESGREATCALDFKGGELTEILLGTADGTGYRSFSPDDFTGEVEVMPVRQVAVFVMELSIPLSLKPIVLNPETVKNIKVVKADLSDIEDLQLDDGTTEVSRTIVMRDIYGYELEFTPEDAEGELIDIALVDIEDSVYNGETQSPVVSYNGEILTEGVDYTWEKVSDEDTFREAGDYEVVLRGKGRFIRALTGTFTILPATYFVASGAGGIWTKGSKETLGFSVKRNADDSKTIILFTGITVDGKEVNATNYTAKAGSVIITLKPEYLETLAAGKHTLTALFTDGSVSTEFTIAEASSVPETGDMQQPMMWILIMALAVLLIAASFVVFKKQKS